MQVLHSTCTYFGTSRQYLQKKDIDLCLYVVVVHIAVTAFSRKYDPVSSRPAVIARERVLLESLFDCKKRYAGRPEGVRE